MTLRIRWLGRVRYQDAYALQHGLWRTSSDDHLLLLEHPHVYTLGVRTDPAHLLVDPASVGADLARADRGGDVTYHGPGQLVGYPVLTVARPPALPDTPAYVHSVEQLLIDTLADLGLPGASRLPEYPGVWLGVAEGRPRKVAAIGVRLSKGRSLHGFALNVAPDLAMFGHIVPCGISEYPVTSLAAEGVGVPMRDVVDAVAARAAERWGRGDIERADVAWRVAPDDMAVFTREGGRMSVRLAAAGVDAGAARPLAERKPEWVRAPLRLGTAQQGLRRALRSLDLVTVCEEAGCPNLSECWADGTATFMINGDRCTRACGFCLVDTRHPDAPDPDEPRRVAESVAQMGLTHAVVTAVARDDLDDGGAAGFVATIRAIRERCPGTAVEVLVPDCKGDPAALAAVFDARPDVLNHNIETVARLQQAVRPSASYARSLAVLARAKDAGLVTKSGLIVGMGETDAEVLGALADLRAVGVDIVTIGQYLRPTARHLPVARWVPPETFAEWAAAGEAMGIGHVEASPLTRSSYHARQAAAGHTPVAAGHAAVGAGDTPVGAGHTPVGAGRTAVGAGAAEAVIVAG
ncbi:MAG TPA: lipoyl synthase [Acidimicrobiales bacterium]|nr:lipoyl synthase [Acidimicrobiales bacterium]